MENLTGGTPPVRYLPCVVPCKLYFIEEEEKQTYTFQQEMIRQGYSCRPLTLDEIHILLSAQYYAFFEIVRHKLEKDEALDRIHLIADFFGSAWKLYFA